MESEVLCGSRDHALGGENFRLPDCRGRLDIDNDRIFHIDQIVRGIGEECLSTRSNSVASDQRGRHFKKACANVWSLALDLCQADRG
jgi:hypothetical protein